MNKLLGRTLVSACFLAMSASAAIAQTPARMDPHQASTPEHRYADRAFSRPTERVEARLAYVKTALKISDAQQSQWDAYANLVRKNAQDREQWINSRHSGAAGRAPQQQAGAIERLERAQSFHAEAVTRINQLLSVEKPLYTALSPEQQKIADVVLNPHRRGMQGPGGRGGFGRG